MEINLQNIFYITASLTMIVVLIVCVWLMRLLFIASKLVKNLTIKVQKWSKIVEDIRYFKRNIESKVLEFLSRITNKRNK